jgi:hypothetical protein
MHTATHQTPTGCLQGITVCFIFLVLSEVLFASFLNLHAFKSIAYRGIHQKEHIKQASPAEADLENPQPQRHRSNNQTHRRNQTLEILCTM